MATMDTIIIFLFTFMFAILILILLFKKNLKIQIETPPEPVEKEEEPPEIETPPEPVEKEKKTEKMGQKKGRISPPNRGGRSRDDGKNVEEKIRRAIQHQSIPEIVCWQRDRVWYIGVEIPEDIINREIEIFQNSVILIKDEFDEYRWVLKEANASVEIQSENKLKYSIPLNKEYLVFKLIGRDLDNGRCVKSPSYGSYLIIVPETWKRNNDLSGPPPVFPQICLIGGYQGHFFNIIKGGDKKIAFNNEKEELILIEYKEAHFEIVGNIINDYSPRLGPLFGDGAISIKSLNNRGWDDINILVIGEEGRGRGRWRTKFIPQKNELIQELPNEVGSKKGGWFFIRVYNTSDDLIESLDFRFIGGLKDINVLQHSVLPSEKGHDIAHIEFLHDLDFTIKPKTDIEKNIDVSFEANKSTLTIPPKDIFDETSWIVGYIKSPLIEINILVERIWWNIGNDEIHPSEWIDKPITLSRDDFAPTSNKFLYIKLPKPRWINGVSVGFKRNKSRFYTANIEEKVISIPLRDFGDSYEVENKYENAYFSIWLNHETKIYESKIAFLPSIKEIIDSTDIDSVGYGKKRKAIARATLNKGHPQIIVNDKLLWEYFECAPEKAIKFMRRLLQIEEVSKVLLNFQVHIIVIGSSPQTMQQAKAATHALARALMYLDPELKRILKKANDFGGTQVKRLPTRRMK